MLSLPPHVTARRSVFPQFFTDGAVSEEVLHALLAAANEAPSHRKTEPWRFRVYRGAGREKLLDLLRATYADWARSRVQTGTETEPWGEKLDKKFGKKINQSPVILLLSLSRDEAASVPEWEEIAAVGAAVQNLWTSLDAYDLGGYWSSPGFLCRGYGEFPGAADNERCLGLFYLGHYAMPDLPRPRGDWRDKVTWIDD